MNLSIIRSLCRQKGITFRDLCREIGITDAGLCKAINKNKISSEYLEKMSKYFDVPVGVFFGETQCVSLEALKHYVDIFFENMELLQLK